MAGFGQLVDALIDSHGERPVQRVAHDGDLPGKNTLRNVGAFAEGITGGDAIGEYLQIGCVQQIGFVHRAHNGGSAAREQWSGPMLMIGAKGFCAPRMQMIRDGSGAKTELRTTKRTGDMFGIPTEVNRGVFHGKHIGEKGFRAIEHDFEAEAVKPFGRLAQPVVADGIIGITHRAGVNIHATMQAVLLGQHGLVDHAAHDVRRWTIKPGGDEHRTRLPFAARPGNDVVVRIHRNALDLQVFPQQGGQLAIDRGAVALHRVLKQAGHFFQQIRTGLGDAQWHAVYRDQITKRHLDGAPVVFVFAHAGLVAAHLFNEIFAAQKFLQWFPYAIVVVPACDGFALRQVQHAEMVGRNAAFFHVIAGEFDRFGDVAVGEHHGLAGIKFLHRRGRQVGTDHD